MEPFCFDLKKSIQNDTVQKFYRGLKIFAPQKKIFIEFFYLFQIFVKKTQKNRKNEMK